MKWLSEFFIPSKTSRALYRILRQSVEQQLLPQLFAEGFEQTEHPVWRGKPTRTELACYPYGIFRRKRVGQDDLVEIVFDERRYPKFRIIFGVAPHDGVMVWGKPFPFQNMGVAECPETYALGPSTNSESYFFVWWPFMGEARIDGLVAKAVTLLPQVWEWFETGAVGPNLVGGLQVPVRRLDDNNDIG